MAEVEHNRWNAEKLLLGYRSASDEEKAEIDRDISLKTKFKKEDFVHYDIRPFADLRPDTSGKSANRFDYAISEGLKLVVEK